MRKRKKALALGAGLLLLVLLAAGLFLKLRGGTRLPEGAVALIGGYPVTEEEFCMVLLGYRSEIYNGYTTEEANREDFWEMGEEGERPLDKIEELALAKLSHCKTVQKMAVDRGMADEFTFEDIQASAREENTKRADTHAAGEAVIGKYQFKEREYYEYLYSDLEAQLVSWIIRNEVTVTDGECEEYYQENKEDDPQLLGEYEEVKPVAKRRIQDARSAAAIEEAEEQTEVFFQKERLDEIALKALMIR